MPSIYNINNGGMTNDVMAGILARYQGANGGQQPLPTVTYNEKDPASTLAQVTARQRAIYEQDYIPVENDAIKSLRDMSIIDDAKERISSDTTRTTAKARSQRELSRFGLRQTAAESESQDNTLALGVAANSADTVNNARLNQFDRNVGFRNELINIGRGVSQSGTQSLTEAGSIQTNRENADRAARAQASANRWGILGSL